MSPSYPPAAPARPPPDELRPLACEGPRSVKLTRRQRAEVRRIASRKGKLEVRALTFNAYGEALEGAVSVVLVGHGVGLTLDTDGRCVGTLGE